MKKSKDKKVQSFLDEVACFDMEKYEIIQKSREIVFLENKKATERVMYGGIMFSLGKDFGGVFVSKKHVSFEFSQGFSLNDPTRVLEGSGNFRRHLKLQSLKDLTTKNVSFFVKDAMGNL